MKGLLRIGAVVAASLLAGAAPGQVFFEASEDGENFGIYAPFWIYGLPNGCGSTRILITSEHLPIVRGSERELVPVEGEGPAPESSQTEPRRVAIDTARALLADRVGVDDPLVDELGASILRSRADRLAAAVAAYERHLSASPEDLIAQRELALALLELRRYERAETVMALAYAANPELGVIPINDTILGEGAHRLREAVVRAVAHAQRAERPEAWLLVTVLMQAEGRQEVAARMLGRAEDLGLDAPIADGLGRGLSTP